MCRLPLSIIALAATIFLAGCNGTLSGCPPLREYDQAFRERLRGEIAVLPHDAAIVSALADYVVLRDQVRACR